MLEASFVLAGSLQLIFWGLWLRTGYRLRWRVVEPVPTGPATVIVCFRNEAAGLAACVSAILAQEYPYEFEVLLVDDNSTDSSTQIAYGFARQDARVKVLHPGKTRPGKKDALAYGIAQAANENLVLTDADCIPASPFWLATMAGSLNHSANLALGVSPYSANDSGSILAQWQRYESAYVSTKYLAFHNVGLTYMGVGRNLAYTKSFFYGAGGFSAHADLPSGDDDLLVGQSARPEKTARVLDAAAWAWSQPHTSWRAYFRQRARHQSVGVHYRTPVIVALTLLAASHGFFYLLGLSLLAQGVWLPVVGFYGLRLLLVIWALAPAYFPALEEGTAAGAMPGWDDWTGLFAKAVAFDLMAGLMYLYLAVAGWFSGKNW